MKELRIFAAEKLEEISRADTYSRRAIYERTLTELDERLTERLVLLVESARIISDENTFIPTLVEMINQSTKA